MDVLLVDDHPIIHDTLRAMVRMLRPSAEVHSQFDLESGLFEARRLEVKLVLLDLGLPGCRGTEALVRFRKAMPHARIVVISADESPEQIKAALSEGAASYVPKTLRPKAMVDALRLILDGGTYAPGAVIRA